MSPALQADGEWRAEMNENEKVEEEDFEEEGDEGGLREEAGR